MKLSALLRPLIDAKVPHEIIMQQIIAFEEEQESALEKRRQSDADRQARKRERDAMSRDVTLRHSDRSLVRDRDTRVDDKTSNSEIEPQLEKQTKRATSALDGFEDWYRAYPHKVQRGAAERAWPKARSLASQSELVEGLRRYVASKPVDRPWQNPATWLNGKGWLDQPGQVMPRGSPAPATRNVEFALHSLRNEMEQAHAVSSTQIEGSGAALFRLPSAQRG